MSKKDYSRSAPGSLVPRSAEKSAAEHEQAVMDRIGKRAYYKGKRIERGRIADQHRWKPKQPRMSANELEAERARCREKARLKLIARIVEKKE